MVPVLFLLGVVLGSKARELVPVLKSFPPLTYAYDYQHAEKFKTKFIHLYRWHKPEFCREYKCPEYEVLEEHEGYELRRYQPSVWASNSRLHDGWLNEEERRMQFTALFRYISGNNNQQSRIPMTLPVLTRMEHMPVLGKSCQCNWTMFFMLPNEYQLNPPKPQDPDVRVSILPAINVYVRTK
ncbi:hypothetical protein CHS0354_029277 [Potamilus streckersoni]|uniref:Uncharacterized protein n=1 Tax=Potamilus streckersoni TaxID=2493646 RepID=A0AAE0W4C8_9BIVA|nr:hypothetical protein CHS0354_029277 [Potamilus streckersoni]